MSGWSGHRGLAGLGFGDGYLGGVAVDIDGFAGKFAGELEVEGEGFVLNPGGVGAGGLEEGLVAD